MPGIIESPEVVVIYTDARPTTHALKKVFEKVFEMPGIC